jgi:hypothetical protein
MFGINEHDLVAKWSDPTNKLNVASIEDYEKKRATALILENMVAYNSRSQDPLGLLLETPTSTAPSSQATGQWSPIAMAVARRATPELFAWKCVGVQPMNGPVGLAYAMRIKYQGHGAEAGFDDLNYWNTFTGNLSGTSGTDNAGTGVSIATAETWGVNNTTTPMPQLTYSMESVAVTAKTRKIAANVSLEALMDVRAMQNIDIKRELVTKLDYQLRSDIDREILGAMKSAAVDTSIGGAAVVTWQTSASDGRWQQEKFNTVANAIVQLANNVAISTRVGAANFAIVSNRVASILQACNSNIFNGNNVNVNNTNVFAEIGTLNNSIKVYVDRYAISDYALVGLKGADGQNECGVVYSPYVVGMQSEAIDPQNFSPIFGLMTRYALTNSLLGAGRYYRQINFLNLSTITQA